MSFHLAMDTDDEYNTVRAALEHYQTVLLKRSGPAWNGPEYHRAREALRAMNGGV